MVSLAFSPDGKTLASGSYDTTVLVWGVTGLGKDRPRRLPLTPQELKILWTNLASEDAAKAYQAIDTLTACPPQTVPLLKENLKPVARVDPQRIARLIADLDSEHFAVREQATQELETLGEQAGPALRRWLAGGPSAEGRRRAERLLARLEAPADRPVRLRELRAVEVLERVGRGEARRALEELAKGAPEARLTQEAKAALGRLAERSASGEGKEHP